MGTKVVKSHQYVTADFYYRMKVEIFYLCLVFYNCYGDLYPDPLQMRIHELMKQRQGMNSQNDMMMQKRMSVSKRHGHKETIVYNRRLTALKQAMEFVHSMGQFSVWNGQQRSVKLDPTYRFRIG